MRPLYESSADLEREGSVAALLESEWSCKLVKLGIKYSLDFVITEQDTDKAIAFCEVKTRNYTMAQIGKFGGYLLSLGKWSAAKELCTASCLPFLLVVKTSDGLYYARFDDVFKPDAVHVRGRKDRGDDQDIEPCVLINVDRFTLV